MKYIVTRIANNNPDINGQKLYLTKLGYWSLNPAHAREFPDKAEAKLRTDTGMVVEELRP